jgi:hypothetical protein
VRVTTSAEVERMRAYLARRNDPRIIHEIIQVDEDEEIDCVYRHLQHGFDKPIHLFSVPPPEDSTRQATTRSLAPGEAWAQPLYGTRSKACPEGTPRIHVDLEKLTHFETLEDSQRKIPSHLARVRTTSSGAVPVSTGDFAPPTDGPSDEHQYARYIQDGTAHVGVESILNLWSPGTELSDEFSLSQIWAVNLSLHQTTEAGWQVYRDKYGDGRARIFAFYTPDDYATGCYNLDRSAFVQTETSIALGGAFSTYSTVGGTQYISPSASK